jgi:hypothetical protein
MHAIISAWEWSRLDGEEIGLMTTTTTTVDVFLTDTSDGACTTYFQDRLRHGWSAGLRLLQALDVRVFTLSRIAITP